ncbi:ABC transporter substrate-binding protein [Cellulomonas fimi]|uniref:Extracellular solute-binding protein family 3 n=1 Tax=Cellulomonas fimi (strain ATCC 484 / DSM 20113 / JCM 1341 / CCUG 24087 / LMG 16345 / NBRC 15513 / NCIMB 8980 / NCTC 7547 / NRS-133) TaxID=590998 RepID=F4H1D2_CELFA|nr:ABC transporter substrate-binding protein [Cellulomonas fimi]AEE45103.1 extracellular solute-binding protein family 3 [Cellulomonas fimi ATCC 484]NNH06334.1 amino acid ABC transporter substrate-binding protein [Cellulomonas fimi]VEH28248.1 Sulfate starvation-induced protein 7 [Cellulomonas fimi]
MRPARWTVLTAVVTALALTACAPVDEEASADATASDGGLATVTEGVLTIATSDPAYEPWVVGGDPANGEGFESAVAYAVAEELGFSADQVEWTVASFDQIIAPGAKDFDFAVNQVSISDERRANLDFSSPYYETTQAVVTLEGSPAADATSLADLQGLRIGAMVGTTSLTAAQKSIAPTSPVSPFNDNDQVKQALTSGLVDAIVVDLPTALYITAAELDGGVLVGQLPDSAGGDEFGLVLDLGSPLTDDVTAAVDALREDGTLAELEAQWLTDAAGAPVLK